MVRHRSEIPSDVMNLIRLGAVLPAHPLALDENRRLDRIRQRALTRYYIDAGAGGVAVGVHTTQFGIRDADLYAPVLRIAAEAVAEAGVPKVLVAGVTGRTDQAVREAQIARDLGYHVVLLNVAAFRGAAEHEILDHCRIIAEEMPIVGFALLPGVGGMHLSYAFWASFAQIENVVAIKLAPFDRYRTIDIIRAVIDAGAADRITLYTGNDDHIGLDLIVPFVVRSADGRQETRTRIRGGLLGHWSVWTKTAVQMLERIHAVGDGADVPADILALDSIVTDCNGAIYDAANGLKGCIPGCLEVLRRQGLLRGTWCLDPAEVLSAGQSEAIDRVQVQYPEMNDDAFVSANLHRWLSDRADAIPLVA